MLDNKRARNIRGLTKGIWGINENKGEILSKIYYRSVELDRQ